MESELADLSIPKLGDKIWVIQRAPVFSLFYEARIVKITKTQLTTTDMMGGSQTRFHREHLHSIPYGDGKYITATPQVESDRMRKSIIQKRYEETLADAA